MVLRHVGEALAMLGPRGCFKFAVMSFHVNAKHKLCRDVGQMRPKEAASLGHIRLTSQPEEEFKQRS